MPEMTRHLGDVLRTMRNRGATTEAMLAMKHSWQKSKRRREQLFQDLLHAAYEVQLAHDAKHDKSFGRLQGELDWLAEIRWIKEELSK